MERVICLIIGYVLGLFQTGYLYGKMHHFDIRKHGSGNAGTTNALRTMGVKAGAVTLVGDCLKCILAVLLVRAIFEKTNADVMPLLSMYAAFGTVLGHNYPVHMGFKGGKGIAVTVGIILSTDWRLALVCILSFIVIVAITKYVSLGSLVMSSLFLIGLILLGQAGRFQMTQGHLLEMYAIGCLFVLSAFIRHRSNIRRLLAGTENKISFKKKEGK